MLIPVKRNILEGMNQGINFEQQETEKNRNDYFQTRSRVGQLVPLEEKEEKKRKYGIGGRGADCSRLPLQGQWLRVFQCALLRIVHSFIRSLIQ